MPHNLFQDRMAWVDEVPWHELGEEVSASATASEMIKAANLDWNVTVERAPGARLLRHSLGRNIYDRYLVCRDPVEKDEKEKVVLASVGSQYTALQNREAFSFFDPFINNKWASFHTAGALGNGERVWVQIKLSSHITILDDDEIDKFLLLSNTHNGSGAVTIRFTPIRVVCQNTLNYARKGGHGVISVRHTRKIAENMKKAEIEKIKNIVDSVFANAEKLFGRMAALALSINDVDDILKKLFPPSDKQKRTNKEPERWTRIREILGNTDITPPKTRNTLWGLYNAIVRDEDYRESREADPSARLERVWFGSGHDLKLKALNVARTRLQQAA